MVTRLTFVLCAALTLAPTARAQPLSLQRLASNLNYPLFLTHAPGDPYRVYIVERPGRIRILDLRTGATTRFLDINPRVLGGDTSGLSFDGGLLGLAFHPDYQTNGHLFVHYVDLDKNDVIARFTRATPDTADPDSEQTVLFLDFPISVGHRGGWLGFSPIDGFLYLTLGDGSNGNDTSGLAQRNDDMWGSVLRIDVNAPGVPYASPPSNPFTAPGDPGADEVWSWGLRNPWRASFDRATGDLWIADVGQGLREEINVQPAPASGGANYGWPCFEGSEPYFDTGVCDPLPPNLAMPLYDYAHSAESAVCSITGGYVYRGAVLPALHGAYFFADYCSAQVWSLRRDPMAPGGHTDLTEWTPALTPDAGALERIVSFGEDAFGELYILRFSQTDGEVFRIVPSAGFADCNANNIADASEIALGLLADADNDGLPDPCDPQPCNGDANADSSVDFDDLVSVLANWLSDYSPATGPGDANGDGFVNFDDLVTTLANWLMTCP